MKFCWSWCLDVLYKVDLFKILFRVISLIEFFILIAICMYILDSLIVEDKPALRKF